jgi:3-oxoacyl-(acyl-carrier-protein) synthase
MNHQNKVQDQCQQAPGFVPGSGAGAMVLEDYETALARGATIYAEVLGGNVNSRTTWFRNNDSPNPVAVQKCIQNALKMQELALLKLTQSTAFDCYNKR